VGNTLRLYNRETGATALVSSTAAVQVPGTYNGTPAFSLSGDGRYTAFLRTDAFGFNLLGVAVYDRVSLATSQANPPAPASTGVVDVPAISADGRFVAFGSNGTAWVTGQVDHNESGSGIPGWDVFLYDRTAGKVSLLSHTAAAPLATGDDLSYSPALSANGSRVVFLSNATNLVAGLADLNQSDDVFAWDASSKSVRAITLRPAGLPSLSSGYADSEAPALSADGRWVAFESTSTHLVAGQVDGNRQSDVFLYDSTTRKTVLVSRTRSSAATTANGQSGGAKLSADGRYVAFFSGARNLVPGANPTGGLCIFLFDRTTGVVAFVARAGFVAVNDAGSQLSPDGRWLAFTSSEPDLVPGQQETDDFSSDVFLWDRTTGGVTLVSHSTAGPAVAGDNGSERPRISSDGRYVAFFSYASNLVAGQTGEGGNLFLWDRTTGQTTLVSHPAELPLAGAGIGSSWAMSADGRFLVFTSRGDLDPSVPPASDRIGGYLYDRTLGTNTKITAPDFSGFDQLAVSADGSQVALTSGDGQGTQIYLYDRATKSITLATHLPASTSASRGDAENPVLSDDGRYLAFTSDAEDLVAGQLEALGRELSDVFLYDRIAGTTTLLSRSQGSAVTAAGDSYLPQLSANGRRIAFGSYVDLADGDFNRQPDVFLFSLDGTIPGGPVTIPPCILFDTRHPANGPALRSNAARVVKAAGLCGVPATAQRVNARMTVFQGTGQGNVRLYPGDLSAPSAGILRFARGQTRDGSFDIPLAPNAGTLTLLPFVGGNGTVGVSLEIDGYTP
jgi:Tol biopolymer transport system component